MENLRMKLLAAAGTIALVAGGAQAQERILNGNMSNFGGAPSNDANVPGGWSASTVGNNEAGFGPVADNSPFINAYADNELAWLWADEADSGQEGYTQNGYAPHAVAKINFDFKLASILATGTWGVQYNNTGAPGLNVSVIHFRIDDDFYAAPLTATPANVPDPSITPLTAGVWYNVQAILDIPGQTYSGSITPSDTLISVPFSGVISNAALDVGGRYVSGTQIRDRAGGSGTDTITNSNITFDNFSVTPEPASLSLLALGGLALARRRK